MNRKVSKEFASKAVDVNLEIAKKYFNNGDYKKSANVYLQIAKYINNWKLNVLGDATDDTRRQKRERDNTVAGDETEQKQKET